MRPAPINRPGIFDAALWLVAFAALLIRIGVPS